MVNEIMLQKQHQKGKLHVEERLGKLFDSGIYRDLVQEQDRDGAYVCMGRVAGKTVVVAAQDFTCKGGTLGLRHGRNIAAALDLAVRKRCPFIALNDSGGARIQEGVDALAGYGEIFYRNVRASGYIPQISVVIGPCAGGAVYSPGITDFILTVDKITQMFITGPKVVQSVTGEKLTGEELGGTQLHARKSGVSHLRYESEAQCFDGLRRLIDLLPSNNRGRARSRGAFSAPSFDFKLPESDRRGYDVRAVIESVFDASSFMEIQAEFAQSMVVGFARLEGATIGIVANQPMYTAGVLDCDSSDKAARFVRFCDAFRIPIVTFTDVPGYMPGREQERAGIIRHGAELLYAFSEATVPKINVILRKAYGGAYIAMNSAHIGADRVFAWPGAQVAVMGEQGAVEILYARQLAALEPSLRAAFIAEKSEEYRRETMNCDLGLAQGYIHEIIKPEQTREKLIGALAAPRGRRRALRKKHGNIPL